MRYLLLLPFVIGFGLVAFQPPPPPKIVKVALLIENTDFLHWESLSLKKSANTVQDLLLQQDFKKENIMVFRNVTAAQFREIVKTFIEKVGQLRAKNYQVIVVTYFCSHGTRIGDRSADEKEVVRGDFKDEIFICKDTPDSQSLPDNGALEKKSIFGNIDMNWDKHPNAIIDDEMGQYNERLIDTIGTGGQYISWADYCESQGTAKSGNNSSQSETGNLIDGGDFADFTPFEKPENPNLSRPSAVLMAATNVEIRTAPNGESYFVQALKAAFQAPYLFAKPTLQSIHDDFKNELLKLEQNKRYISNGKEGIFLLKEGQVATHALIPKLHQFTPNSEEAPMFLGVFKSVSWSVNAVVKKALNLKGDPNDLTFEWDNLDTYKPYSYVQVKAKGSKQLTEGLLIKVSDKKGTVLLPANAFKSEEYTIEPNPLPHQNAAEALQNTKTKIDLREVLKALHSPLLGVKVSTWVDAYERKTLGDTIRFIPQQGIQLKQGQVLTTQQNITIKVDSLQPDLYYTIVDVTSEKGIQACYTDSYGQGRGFSFIHRIPLERVAKNGKIINLFNWEDNHFRSQITPPLGSSFLWVLVSDAPIDDQVFRNVFLGNSPIQSDTEHFKLWEMLKHIRYFEEINYVVSH
ncbi:caspase family protein [Runella sp. SP2]|uniref:caspase family protein n=1 Tax=Runella sp. SP2 TaxID=2268026 RepID=UPI000F083FE8|nr:caspase family protein [Runella sp. SP2]AYQ36567.1 hypothetical protein DTQ70_30055 [Runella sp. SP2]